MNFSKIKVVPKPLKCDYLEKVAFEPFPPWNSNWPRTDFAPSLDKYADRAATLEVSYFPSNFLL